MTFANQPFSTRIGAMGDESEGQFDLAYPAHHKLGLNRPPMNVSKMSLKMRYTPDRMVQDCLVECMGIGYDQRLKVKTEKIRALFQWEASDNVSLFVWDRKNKRHTIGPLDMWVDAMWCYGEFDVFPEGKPFVSLHTSDFPYTWTDVTA